MNRENIRQRLVQVIADSSAETFDPNAVTETTTLDYFGVDSLVMIDLIFDLEQEFGVKMQAEELTALKTVGDLVSYLEGRIAV